MKTPPTQSEDRFDYETPPPPQSAADRLTVQEGESLPVPGIAGPQVRQFGDYELLGEIARGGMGVVFKARQTSLNRIVALKLISSGALASPEAIKRFKIEAEAAAALNHPNIVAIYEIGEVQGQNFFSMRLIDGPNLNEYLCREGGDGQDPERNGGPSRGFRNLKEAAGLVLTLSRAVHHAHQHGVLHRDIKPGNVLLDANGTPHLTDFGLAKFTESASTLTQSEAILGTPSFMAPEQARGEAKNVTTAADVYALGAVLYTCLTGKPPFADGATFETIRKVMEEDPRRPSAWIPEIDPDLETVCLKCLSKEIEARYPTAEALANDLQRWLRSEPIEARPATALERARKWARRRPTVAALAAATCCLAAVVFGGAIFYAHRERARASVLQENLARQYLRQGRDLCESGDIVRGLHWLARSLKETPARSSLLAADIRRNIGNWSARVQPPRAILPTERPVVASAQSSDGTIVAAADDLGRVRFWRSDSGLPIALEIHHPKATALAFSPDGRHVATIGDGAVRIWDVATGAPVGATLAHPKADRVLFSPNGSRLMTHGGDFPPNNEVRVWQRDTGALLGRPLRHEGGHARIWSAAFSSDGRLIVTACGDKTARIWDCESGSAFGKEMPHQNEVVSAVFSPDGRRVLTASQDGTARLWDSATGDPVGEPMFHAREVWNAIFSRDGAMILTGSIDGTARLWDGDSGVPIAQVDHGEGVGNVQFVDGSKYFLTAGQNGSGRVRVWSAERNADLVQELHFEQGVRTLEIAGLSGYAHSGSNIFLWDFRPVSFARGLSLHRQLPYGELSPEAIAFDHPGARLLMGDHLGSNWWWSIETGAVLPAEYFHEARESFLDMSPNGELVLSSGSGVVRLWSVASGNPTRTFDSWFRGKFSPDGKTIALSAGTKVRLWSLQTDRWSTFSLENMSEVIAADLSPDGRLLCAGCADGKARLWSVETGAAAGALNHGATLKTVAFSPDSKLIVTGGTDKLARVWNATTRLETGVVLQHRAAVEEVIFSPDGQLAASASSEPDDRIRIWNPLTGEILGPILHLCCGVNDIVFTRDGQRLAIAGANAAPTIVAIYPVFDGSFQALDSFIARLTSHTMDAHGVLHPVRY